jgi:hypothetical protein
MRQFIEDALYDPSYGYFVKNANIFQLGRPLDFRSMVDIDDYQTALSKLYKEQSITKSFYQLWHTPSELFQPHYAQAVGKYILKNTDHSRPLVIYEVGPGSGTFCEGLSDYFDQNKVKYEYNLIEISSSLYDLQRQRFKGRNSVRPRHVSFFDIERVDDRPCFVIALEVLDNLAQDVISFSKEGELLECAVEVDEGARPYTIPGMYDVKFEPSTDPLIINTFNAMDEFGYKWRSLRWNPLELFKFLGFDQSFKWQYIPSKVFQFFDQVSKKFPNSKLIISDFDKLPDKTPGFDSPVVQTRYNGDTVSCSKILLKKGLFDIFFPTNFDLAAHFCKVTTTRQATVMKHKLFLEQYADCSKTRTKTGYNPMLEEFENVSFLLS